MFIKKISFRVSAAALLSVLYSLILSFILNGSLSPVSLSSLYIITRAFIYFLLLYEGFLKIISHFNLIIKPQQDKITEANLVKALGTFCLYSSLLLSIIFLVPSLLGIGEWIIFSNRGQELRMIYIINLIFSMLYFFMLKGYDIIHQLNQAKLEAEKMEKVSIQTQMETLKSQISPHFLFNSLNALSSLIYINEDKAVRFVDELASIFQYVTEHKNRELVPLKDEIDFINAFYYLLKIRFRESLHMELNITAMNLEDLIPPLTLQLLVENAIKHNIVSKADPLTIRIRVENKKLLVSNNLQIRNRTEKSTGVGLSSIIRRYGFLSEEEVEIFFTNNEFLAKVPLIKPEGVWD